MKGGTISDNTLVKLKRRSLENLGSEFDGQN